MSDPKPSFHPSPSRPKLHLPAGACDAHVHVFGPHDRLPFAEDRPFTPADVAAGAPETSRHSLKPIALMIALQRACSSARKAAYSSGDDGNAIPLTLAVAGRALESGHYLAEEAPEAVVEELLRFFAA